MLRVGVCYQWATTGNFFFTAAFQHNNVQASFSSISGVARENASRRVFVQKLN